MLRHARQGSPVAPLTQAAPAELPILVGCAGRCGRVMAIRLPERPADDPTLAELRGELHRIGWSLTTAAVGESQEPAIAMMCDPCVIANGPAARRGRVGTLSRGLGRT